MKPRFLLPHSFKKFGWMLLIPSVIFGIIVQHFEYEIPGFALAVGSGGVLVSGTPLKNNLTNELAGVLILVSGFVVAFSKEKLEDEYVSKVRLESLQWSVYLNYGLLLLALLFVFDEAFFYVMIYNLYTILVFFIVRFNFVMHLKDRWFHKTETA
ncbi:MAG: hypothetical protein WA874_06195 [Chryseosolibacter sp.]